jgi:hypothetical protein
MNAFLRVFKCLFAFYITEMLAKLNIKIAVNFAFMSVQWPRTLCEGRNDYLFCEALKYGEILTPLGMGVWKLLCK